MMLACTYICAAHVYLWRPEESALSPEIAVPYRWLWVAAMCGYWQLILVPLQEQQAFLTARLFL